MQTRPLSWLIGVGPDVGGWPRAWWEGHGVHQGLEIRVERSCLGEG